MRQLLPKLSSRARTASWDLDLSLLYSSKADGISQAHLWEGPSVSTANALSPLLQPRVQVETGSMHGVFAVAR